MEIPIKPELDTCRSVFQVTTPSGTGAVAVIAVQLADHQSPDIALSHFKQTLTRSLEGLPTGRILFGTWRDEEIVIVRVSRVLWEIQCHGGRAAVNRIRHDLHTSGLSERDERQVVRQTQRSTETDALRRARHAINDVVDHMLPHCRTLFAAEVVLSQRTNGLASLLARTVAPEHTSAATLSEDAEATRRHLATTRNVARHLTTPWRVVLAGAPNVGKSSLMNAIAGRDRALVSEIAGTTRDQLEADIIVDGWVVTLIDTAGVRSAPESALEAAGIELTYAAIHECDLVVLVDDRTQDDTSASPQLPRHVPVIHVLSKCDLAAIPATYDGAVRVSAVTGAGLDELRHAIITRLVPFPVTPQCPLLLPGLEEFTSARGD